MDINAIPYQITSTDANEIEINITAPGIPKGVPLTMKIEVVSGTWNFNVGGSATDSNINYTAGDEVLLAYNMGPDGNVKAKPSAGSEVIKVSVI